MSCNYCWPGNCCGSPNCEDTKVNISTSPLAYDDARETFERALRAVENGKNGIRIKFETRGGAVRFRHRMNRFRTQDRQAYARIYPDKENPLHNTSPYDRLELTIPPKGSEEECYLVIRRRTSEAYQVEEL